MKKIIQAVGHDGGEILWPDLPEPQRRRSFHLQEIIDVMWLWGHSTTVIEHHPVSLVGEDCYYSPLLKRDRWSRYLIRASGVLIGSFRHPHAVAYDRGIIYDPNGSIYSLPTSQRLDMLIMVR